MAEVTKINIAKKKKKRGMNEEAVASHRTALCGSK